MSAFGILPCRCGFRAARVEDSAAGPNVGTRAPRLAHQADHENLN